MRQILQVCLAILLVIAPSELQGEILPYQDPHLSDGARVEDLLSRMTLDEKVGQMVQPSISGLRESDIHEFYLGALLSGGGQGPSTNTPEAWADMIDSYQSLALSTRLQIPLLYAIDAVHGHANVYGATVFPHNIGLGATSNPELVERVAQSTAIEVAATGVHWAFAPTIAVARHEGWGRTYESFSEDTDLVSELGAAAVKGLQGDDIAATTSTLATAKHFAGDGGTSGGQDTGDTLLNEVTFRAIHLPPYTEAIAAGVRTVMVSLSSWNGLKMHEHRYLITDVLKGEMGFDGLVVSDWAGVGRIDPSYSVSVIKSINAGIDVVIEPDKYRTFLFTLKAAVEAGEISENRIDDAVRRILRAKFESGLFENPYAPRELLSQVGSAAHRAVARQAVADSIVVLKDEKNLLPLAKNLPRIHVAGKNADNLGYQCGGWTIYWQGGSGDITVGTTILEGIEKSVSDDTLVTYSLDGTGAEGATIGIVVVGETPYAEHLGDTEDLYLSPDDLSAIDQVRQSGIPLIVILVSGRPMFIESELPQWDALLAAWLPGSEGQGVADILFGDRFPVGILSHSWPRDGRIPINPGGRSDDPLFPLWFSIYRERDGDQDGLNDRWEARHGLNPWDDGSIDPDNGASGNPDGDTGDNLYEFLSGTDPQSPHSIFQISEVQYRLSGEPPSVHLTAHTVPGYRYEIDFSDAVGGSSLTWQPFANSLEGAGSWTEISSDESRYTFIDDFTPGSSGGPSSTGNRYYRIRSTSSP